MLQSLFQHFRLSHLTLPLMMLGNMGVIYDANANDASAMLDAGGIRLVETNAISLDVEDLYISPEQIRIHYEFFNHSDEDQRMLVAFPVPEIEAEPEWNYGINNADPINFLGFSVHSNGQPITPELEVKLTMNGRDYTDDLVSNGVPLHRFAPDYYDRLEDISDSAKEALAAKGLINWTPGEAWFDKKWKVKATYYWWQDFPANSRTVLDHSYAPVVGGGVIDEQYGIRDNMEHFCIDDSFMRGFRRLLKKGGHETTVSSEVRYILKTANTWLGPIGDFRLVIDKMQPDNLITLCINGIRKIAPTQFEFRARNYVPDQNLDIMVVKMPDW
ncbi:DUF4424 family protein [uncultured Cohaesibacter sp.]|uniref:DUF4424 family protein n=1 Tax=uncultured Cohaesibacter sp. TaxID=1002546 RepID=UPI002AA61F5B|nr:DUF4424 family protein [uncultured Cohaesibacter sp.]